MLGKVENWTPVNLKSGHPSHPQEPWALAPGGLCAGGGAHGMPRIIKVEANLGMLSPTEVCKGDLTQDTTLTVVIWMHRAY